MSRRVAAAGLLALRLTGALAGALAAALPAAGQPWVGERLCAPQPLPAGAELGSAVAVGGDGTIAVGDYRHDVVYLFDAAGSCPPTAVKGPDGAWFGFSLAIDGGQMLVGAPKSGGTGAAYLVDLDPKDGKPSAPRQVAGLLPPPGAGDEVGSAVAMSAVAMDGKILEILAIGARGAEGRSGRVYAGRDGGLTAISTPPGLAPRAELGQSVALGQSVVPHTTTLAMGAPSPFRGSGSPGAAYVLELSADGSPGTPVLLLPTGLEPEAAFGYAVAVDGQRILVGAPLADRDRSGSGVDAGTVFSFRRKDGGWAQDTQPPPTGGRGDQLGVAVALDQGTAPGQSTAVIGARYANGARGAAFLLAGNGSPQPLAQTVPAGAQFGFSVAIRSGIAAVGAFRENGVGAAYRFAAPPPHPVETPVTVEFATPSSSVLASAGTVPLLVIVHGPAGGLPVTVDLNVVPQKGTARPGRDFLLSKSSHTLEPGTPTEKPFPLTTVPILPDPLAESPRTFWVQLSAQDTAVLGKLTVHEVIINESPLVVPTGPLHTSEAGGSAPLEVRLAVQPAADVLVSLSTSDSTEGIVSPDRLRFTPENWDRGQTVQVVGQDDEICDGSVAYEIQVTTASADPRFAGLSQSVPAENADDERACLSAGQSVCTDGGGTVVYTLSLANSVAGVPDTPAQLLDALPPEVSVVTASADRGTAIADPIANSVRWTGPVPAAGNTVTITIVAALDGPPSPTVINHADLIYVRDSRGTLQIAPAEVALPGDVCP